MPDIFGGAVLTKLQSYSGILGELRIIVQNLDDATDAGLEENLKVSRILDVIDECGWTPEGLRLAADRI